MAGLPPLPAVLVAVARPGSVLLQIKLMPHPPLLLASTSPHRQQLLERLALSFRTRDPGVDESAARDSRVSPAALAAELARQKADAIASREPAAVVIGADQVCAAGQEVLGKPGSTERAVRQLTQLQGRSHVLVSAVCVMSGERRVEFQVTARMRMRGLSDDEIARYVALDAPLNCAGSYRIEAAGIALFDRVDCEDFTAIVGLPLLSLAAALRSFGYAVP